MPCPFQRFAGLPHVLETIFVTHLPDYKDWTAAKQVCTGWKEAMEEIECSNAAVMKERIFCYNWFDKEHKPLVIKSKGVVSFVRLSSNGRWLFLEMKGKMVAYDIKHEGNVSKEIPYPSAEDSTAYMSDSNDPMAEIRASFFIECEELLEALQDGLQAMDDGADDSETINIVFRAVHSIKGGAGAFGLEALVRFAHRFETVMDEVRAGRMSPDAEALKLFFHCADHLSDLTR